MSGPEEPSGFVADGGSGTLSMRALVDLLTAVTEKGRPFRVQALGFSMYPFIRNRDIITISPLPAGGPGLGDVVAFIQQETGRLVVHRVVRRTEDGYFIRGDNMPEPDGLISADSIRGYVTKVERDGKPAPLGSGPERYLIAVMSSKGLLCPSLSLACRLLCPAIRRIKT